jgi:tetratricopeptide (TPR) repeat protein
MARNRGKGRGVNSSRPRIPPPAPYWRVYSPDGGIWGQSILSEHDDSLGLLFWRAARATRLFIASAENARSRLTYAKWPVLRRVFALDEVDVPEALRESVQAFPKLLSRDETVSEAEIAEACTRVAGWAEENWKAATAFEFAELASKAQPSNPQRATYAGRVCRGMGLFDRASVWFERGFRLAVQQGNRSESVRALLGQGALMQECGRLDDAQRWFIKAARRAARTGRKKRAAEARHDLMALAAERGDFPATVEHARVAVDLYPLRHQRLPYLAHDFAFALLRQGSYPLALALLEVFVRVVPRRNSLPGLATFAWAAAGRGALPRYADAERRALQQIAVDDQQAAASLVILAEAACAARNWERAERHAVAAVEAARRLKQQRYERDAQALIQAIRQRTILPAPPGAEVPEALQDEVKALVRHLLVRVRRWKPRDVRFPDQPADSRKVSGANGS